MPPAVWAGAAAASAATTTMPAAMPQDHDVFTGIPLKCVPVIVLPAALPQALPLTVRPPRAHTTRTPANCNQHQKGICMLRPWIGRFVAAASMSILATAACGDERPGNLWDTTSQMSMTGMSMPAQKMQLCTAKEWTEPPPPPPGQSCTTTDFQKTDNKVTW